MEEQILAVDLSTEQTLEVNLPEQDNVAQIDVYWQDEVVLDLDASLMYIVSGQQEIQDYVNNKSKPEIDEYIETYAKPIVAEVVEQEAAPIIDEYFDGTVKPSITAFAEEEMAGYAQTATEQATIASTQAGLAEASAVLASTKAQEVDVKITEFETIKNTAISSVNQAKALAITAIDNETSSGKAELNVVVSNAQQYATQASNSATSAINSAAQAKAQADKVNGVVNSIEGCVGDIGFAPLGIDETQNKRRYLNGQVISQAQFKSFTNKIKFAIELTPSLATSETNWQAEVTNSVLGQCGKFVIDDALGTIRLPKVVNIQGLQDLALMGSIKAESLPNITGESHVNTSESYAATGAFYKLSSTSCVVGGAGTNPVLGFDASRSSSTYQDNAPVQQEAIQYPYFIQVATGVEETVDVLREIELNNPFSLLDYKWSEYELTNASWLISNGSFHSGAIYKAVYELLLKIKNGVVTKDGVSVKLSTEAYEDTDFVINTSDTTFRLPVKVKLASGNAVVGNGMTLGLTNGTNNYGLSATDGAVLEATTGNYGTNVDTTPSPTAIRSKTLGITIDPTKSGLVLADNDMYLYFYVGETIQDANVINASGVLTTIANLTTIVETYSNGSSWYRVWSDGWCEQGGIIIGIGDITVSFLKPFANTNYIITGSYVDTSTTDSATIKNVSFWNRTTTSFSVRTSGSAGDNKNWYACGYIA